MNSETQHYSLNIEQLGKLFTDMKAQTAGFQTMPCHGENSIYG